MAWSDAQKRYAKSESGKAARLKYQQSEAGKASRVRYLAKKKALQKEAKEPKEPVVKKEAKVRK